MEVIALQPDMPNEPVDGDTPVYGTIVVEGKPTGEDPAREFAPGSLTWDEPPLALKWQPAESAGHDGAMIAARMDIIWRDGDAIRFVGAMDSQGAVGAEAQRLMAGGFLHGVSIMADDTTDEDVEIAYDAPDGDEPERDLDDEEDDEGNDVAEDGYAVIDESEEMAKPRKIIIHKARIRSATLLPEPAFVEAQVFLGKSPFQPPDVVTEEDEDVALTAAAVGSHDTATSDGAWDGPANEQRLPSPMSVAAARAAYAWVDNAAISDDTIQKVGLKFIHHEVSADGSPGAANLRACSTGIGVLNGGRGGTTIPGGDVQGVYDHLAAHLRDADREPPPLTASTGSSTVTAAAYTITIPEVWPESWFAEPAEMPPFGALHVTPEGRVYGLLAPDKVSHRGFRAQGRSITVPRGVDYSEFQNKPALVASSDGGVYRINAGAITFGCGHASPMDPRREDPNWALQHYDNSCSIAARVRVGENKHGTWVAGGLLHDISSDVVERMMGCALSGDWQGGKLKAALLVPVEGFPRAATASVRIRDDAMVASTVPLVFDAPEPELDFDEVFDVVLASIGRDVQSRYAALLAELGR
jgi:hypothetical protein